MAKRISFIVRDSPETRTVESARWFILAMVQDYIDAQSLTVEELPADPTDESGRATPEEVREFEATNASA